MSRKLKPLIRPKTPTRPFDADRGALFAQGDPFAFPALGSPFGSRLTKRASLLPKSGKAKSSLYFDSDADMQRRQHEATPQVLDQTESESTERCAPGSDAAVARMMNFSRRTR